MTRWVTRLLIANVVVYFILPPNHPFQPVFAFRPLYILQQPWSVFTYMFLHGGFMHLFFNMLVLYFFGPRLEQRLGSKDFLGLYFTAGVVGALLSLVVGLLGYALRGVLPPQIATSLYQTLVYGIIGASGAMFGVMLGYAQFWPRDRILIMFILPIEVRLAVLLFAVASIWFGLTGAMGGVAHFAHLGGFVGGYLYLRWMDYRSPARQFKRQMTQPVRRSPGGDGADIKRWDAIDREAMHPVNREELERVLGKVKASGVGSLTPDERAFLDRFSTK